MYTWRGERGLQTTVKCQTRMCRGCRKAYSCDEITILTTFFNVMIVVGNARVSLLYLSDMMNTNWMPGLVRESGQGMSMATSSKEPFDGNNSSLR